MSYILYGLSSDRCPVYFDVDSGMMYTIINIKSQNIKVYLLYAFNITICLLIISPQGNSF